MYICWRWIFSFFYPLFLKDCFSCYGILGFVCFFLKDRQWLLSSIGYDEKSFELLSLCMCHFSLHAFKIFHYLWFSSIWVCWFKCGFMFLLFWVLWASEIYTLTLFPKFQKLLSIFRYLYPVHASPSGILNTCVKSLILSHKSLALLSLTFFFLS